jgi:hypothetical protein
MLGPFPSPRHSRETVVALLQDEAVHVVSWVSSHWSPSISVGVRREFGSSLGPDVRLLGAGSCPPPRPRATDLSRGSPCEHRCKLMRDELHRTRSASSRRPGRSLGAVLVGTRRNVYPRGP